MEPRRPRNKYIGFYLEREVYARLERRGEANERDPIQELRWLVKEALRNGGPQDTPRLPVEAGAH